LLISSLLVILIIRLVRSWNRFDRTRSDINTSRFANGLSIDFLWFDDEDSIRKRFLAFTTRKLIGEDFNLDTENTLAEQDVTSSLINKITDLN
jgi:hypothetical protein